MEVLCLKPQLHQQFYPSQDLTGFLGCVDAALVFSLLEGLVETSTIRDCSGVFTWLERHPEELGRPRARQAGQYNMLRVCNQLLRRLSKGHDAVLCGWAPPSAPSSLTPFAPGQGVLRTRQMQCRLSCPRRPLVVRLLACHLLILPFLQSVDGASEVLLLAHVFLGAIYDFQLNLLSRHSLALHLRKHLCPRTQLHTAGSW